MPAVSVTWSHVVLAQAGQHPRRTPSSTKGPRVGRDRIMVFAFCPTTPHQGAGGGGGEVPKVWTGMCVRWRWALSPESPHASRLPHTPRIIAWMGGDVEQQSVLRWCPATPVMAVRCL